MQSPLPARHRTLSLLLVGLLTTACAEEGPSDSDSSPAPAAVPTPTSVGSPASPEPICCLQPGDVAGGDLPSQGRVSFAFPLRAGDGLELLATQEGADVALLVSEPSGEILLRLDRPVGRSEPEILAFVARKQGTHHVQLENVETSGPGQYRVQLVSLAPATDAFRTRARAIESLARGHELRRGREHGEAVSSFREAAEHWRDLGDGGREADALDWTAWCLSREGDPEDAVEVLRRAIRGFEASGQIRRQAFSLGDLGDALRTLGRTDEALETYREALPLWQNVSDVAGEAMAHTHLANLHKARNELSAAELRYKEALALWERLDRGRDQAITLANLAGIYTLAGQPELALDILATASELASSSARALDRAFLLEEAAVAHRRLGQQDQAFDAYRRALELYRAEGSVDRAAGVLRGLGRLHYDAGDYGPAQRLYQQALSLLDADQYRLQAAVLVQSIGWIHLHQGQLGQALDSFQVALPRFQELGFSAGEAATLLGIARVERQLGHLETALDWALRSLDVLEELRHGSDRLDLRTSLLATRQSYFDFAIDTLMELHHLQPEGGFADLAFQVSERGRARGLLDALPAGRHTGTAASSSDDPDRLASLRERVNSAEKARLALLAADAGDQALARAERDLRSALEELRSMIDRIEDPAQRSSAPRPLSLEEIQSSLLDSDTLLLSYDLGEDRSYLWAVSEDGVETFVLPSAQEIERQARGTHYLLSHSRNRASSHQVELRIEELGRLLLAPAADRIHQHRRLLISLEGDLHLLPLGALPLPRSEGSPLLATHEVIYVPSASAVIWMARRPPPAGERARIKTLAVLADPVFGPDDPRLHEPDRLIVRPRGRPTPPAMAGPDLPRLQYTEQEADAVLSLIPPSDGLSAKSFAARKALVLGGGLSSYRILHFATHGWFSAEHPELSALVLSRLDEEGRSLDGVLWAHEIAALALRAELVVLNACETGLGARIHGEGLVGLADAFFAAGVPTVVASLWRVDDRAAVEVVTRFYRGYLEQGLSSGEALRRAQLSVREHPRWERPYYWAGFVLQGRG